jgi:hypothetical protein
VLLGGAIARVHLRRTVYGTLSARRYALELAALLFLLFHTFFAAWFSVSALLAGERALAVWRRRPATSCPSRSKALGAPASSLRDLPRRGLRARVLPGSPRAENARARRHRRATMLAPPLPRAVA